MTSRTENHIRERSHHHFWAAKQDAAQKAGQNFAKCLAVLLLAFPYLVFPPAVTALFLLAVSAIGIGLGLRHRTFSIDILWVFFLVMFGSTIIAFNSGARTEYIIVQANHFWQFFILFGGAVSIFRLMDLAAFLREKLTRRLLILSSAITVSYSFYAFGALHEFSPNLLFLLISYILLARINFTAVVMLVIISAIFISTSRSSPLIVIAILAFVWAFNPRLGVVKALVAIIVFGPVIIYLSLGTEVLTTLITLDHNSYIRAEFIRAASSTLKDYMLTGVGFGTSYRPLVFPYLSDHILLIDPRAMNIVSNHHSFFDTAYRLGIPAAFILYYRLFIAPHGPHIGKMIKFIMLTLAVGMSLNAWFENQAQLPIVALFAAVIVSVNRVKYVYQ